MKTIGIAVWPMFFLLVAGARGDADLPDLGPIVISTFPLGARQGETLDVEISGRSLNETRAIVFVRPDIKAQVLSSDFSSVKVRVSVDAKSPVGLFDYRLLTPHGTHVGVFPIGSLPRQNEVEPNSDLKRAQRVTLPAMIDGTIDGDDYDVFRFHAEAGQTLVFDVMSTRVGTRFDSTLSVLDERGAEVEFVDDFYIQKDPHLSYTVKKTGDYFIRVAASTEPIAGLFEGGPYSSYRLLAGTFPHMLHALPAGIRRGSTSEFQVTGMNLGKIDRVVLGDSLAEGKVVKSTVDSFVVRMPVPASIEPGQYPLRAFAGSFEAPLSLPLVVSDLDEALATPTRSRRHPQNIKFPIALSGVFDRKGAADFFAFDVQAGECLVFDVDSMKLGFLDDPLIALYTADGKLLASHDDRVQQNGDESPNLDSYLVYTFEKAGRYVAMIRDCAERGDPNYVYRLAISPGRPDFDLRSLTPELTLYRGHTVELPLRVRRFGGWSAPVEVWIENLPAGITSQKVTAEPKDTIVKDNCALDRQLDGTNIYVPIHVAANAPAGDLPLRLRARGVLNGKVVERSAEILYWWEHVGKVSGSTQEQKLVATVTDLPPVVFEAAPFVPVTPGKSARLQVLVRRFDGGKSTLKIQPEAPVEGVTFEDFELGPDAPRVIELKLKIADSFKMGLVKLRAGSAISPPIVLTVQEEEQ